MNFQYEEMGPEELDAARKNLPVALVPLGTLEFHGYHLPAGFDAIKAWNICMKIAERLNGGVVLPPLYWGVGGGHTSFDSSIIMDECVVLPGLVRTFDRLSNMGFRVIVAITGHYPGEQVEMVQEAARQHMDQDGGSVVIALPEYEAFEGEHRADHAAKWETSIMMALRPDLVHLERFEGKEEPLHGIFGEDPRLASRELGEETVNEIVENLANQIRSHLT